MALRDYDRNSGNEKYLWNHLRGSSRSNTPGSRVRSWSFSRIRSLRRLIRRRQPTRNKIIFIIQCLSFILILTLSLTSIFAPSCSHPPAHYQELARRCKGQDPVTGCANPNSEKVFIASVLHDSNGELVKGKWGHRVLGLIDLLGPANVFISIYEYDTGPKGREAVEAFKKQLPCHHHIASEDTISLAGFQNVTLPDGTPRTKRVAYLAELRNRALRPLDRFIKRREDQNNQTGVTFDKVLFIDDIAFNPIDAAHLLFNTNHQPSHDNTTDTSAQASYLAACALSYSTPFHLDDIYSLRDAEGYANHQTLFPYFRARPGAGWFRSAPKSASRVGITAQTDAVRVKSCWGGMMAVRARYIQNLSPGTADTDTYQPVAEHVINPDEPPAAANLTTTTPVRFRYEPDAYYDASEFCLLSADLAQAAATTTRSTSTPDPQIFINPYIRTSPSSTTLSYLPYARRLERLLTPVFDIQSFLTPVPRNPSRAIEPGEWFAEEIWDGDRWVSVERRWRAGLFCGVRGMQVVGRGTDHDARGENEKRDGNGRGVGVRVRVRVRGREVGEMGGGRRWVNMRVPPRQKGRLWSLWGGRLPKRWRAVWEMRAGGMERGERERFWEDE